MKTEEKRAVILVNTILYTQQRILKWVHIRVSTDYIDTALEPNLILKVSYSNHSLRT